MDESFADLNDENLMLEMRLLAVYSKLMMSHLNWI